MSRVVKKPLNWPGVVKPVDDPVIELVALMLVC